MSGVTGSIGSIDRPGVGRQLTMDKRPLYTFSGDRPGEVRGNGVGNLWWAMTPTGLTATSFPVETTTYGAPGLTTLRVVATAVGPAVANDRGQVLYEYGDDTPSTSNCGADWCLVDWPPLEVSGAPTVPSGITAPIAVSGVRTGRVRSRSAGTPCTPSWVTSTRETCVGKEWGGTGPGLPLRPTHRDADGTYPMKHARTSWRRLGRVVAVTMLGVVPLMLSSCSGSSGGSAASPITQVGGPAQTNPRYPGAFIFPRPYPMPDVTLTDTSGAPYDIGSHTAATVTLLYFGYTHCPDLCPLNMATTASAIEGLPARIAIGCAWCS